MPSLSHRMRSGLTRLQYGLLGPNGPKVLDRHRGEVAALRRPASKLVLPQGSDRKLRSQALRNLSSDRPEDVAWGIAQLSVDKTFDRRFLAKASEMFPSLADIDVEVARRDDVSTAPSFSLTDVNGAVLPSAPSADYLALGQARRNVGLAAALLHASGTPRIGTALFRWIYGGALAQGLTTLEHMHVAEREWVERALDGDMGMADVQAFMHKMGGVADAWPARESNTRLDTLGLIDASRGPGRTPHWSKPARAHGVANFMNMAALMAATMQRDKAHGWHKSVTPASMTIMHHFGWQPEVLHPERLEALQALRRRGVHLMFLPNHRSYLDIPTLALLLRDFQIRFVAKRELQYVPIFGCNPLIHPNAPGLFHADSCLASTLLIERSSPASRAVMIRSGLAAMAGGDSLVSFGPGTRTRTLHPGREVGLATFKTGFANILLAALQKGLQVAVVPVHIVGTGSMFGNDIVQTMRQGVWVNQRTLLEVGEPLMGADLMHAWEADAAYTSNAEDAIRFLTRHVWAAAARELIPIQQAML